jgi:starch synthase
MHIIHIASEIAPIAKVGGLADVVLGLSRELSWKDHEVDIIIPKYDCMNSNEVRDLSIYYHDLSSYYNGEWFHNTIWTGWVENLKVYFIEPHHPRHFFNRGCFYGCEDDIERYLYFCRAALDFMVKTHLEPDILHLHDWQTAAVMPLYEEIFKKKGWTRTKTVFTIHNIEYQGIHASYDLDRIGLKGKEIIAAKLSDTTKKEDGNLLKGALLYADHVTTVSPNYAWELTTPEGGRGLNKTILGIKNKFSGILNGIDYTYWSPETDRYLPARFSSREMPFRKNDKATLDKKAYVKKVLRERLNLSEIHSPIVSSITRLVPQKGTDLIKHALERTIELNGQFVLLGSSPIPSITAEFHDLKAKYSDHPQVHFILHHQEELAHLIYAGSDIFIVPSLFEPCGLTQMIALKYGTIPIVRKTGGLADTIADVDYSGRPFEETNGYVFDFPDKQGVNSALDRAINTWFHDPDKWRRLMIHGMEIDFSWARSSEKYLEIYKKILGKP